MSQFIAEQTDTAVAAEALAPEGGLAASGPPRNMAHRASQPEFAGQADGHAAPAPPVPPIPEDMHDVRLALENFSALLQSMDFGDEMALLGVTRLYFWKRRRLKLEFVALTMGLWRLALERSFPHYWQAMFEAFLKRKLEAYDDPHKATLFEKTVRGYLELLERKRETDFTEVGAHLVDLLKLPEPKAAPLRLRLTLHIRSLYTLVFDRLI